MITTLALLALLPQASPWLTVSPRLELGGAYDTNVFFDAATLPTDVPGAGGASLAVGPALSLVFHLPDAHRITLSYGGLANQLLSGSAAEETSILHQASVAYTTAPWAQFRLTVGVAGGQQWYHQRDVGWRQLVGTVALDRPLGTRIRAELAYHPTAAVYDAGGLSSEILHEVEGGMIWRVAAGWMLQARYAALYSDAASREYSGWRHRGQLGVSWLPSWLPIEVDLTYRVSGLARTIVTTSTDTTTGTGRVGVGTGGGTTDTVVAEHLGIYVVHRGDVTVRVPLWRDIYSYLSCEAALGWSSTTAIDRVDRYRATAGVGWAPTWFVGGRGAEVHPIRPRKVPTVAVGPPPGGLEIELHAPGARQVALIGSFNEWDPQRTPLQRGADGSWRIALPVPKGEHRYMLWVDGEVRDPPRCRRWLPDGFGGRSCVFVRQISE